MTLKELRKAFWHEANLTRDELLEYETRKTQNDYSTDIRCKWCDFVEVARRNGWITEAQANRATL